MTERQNPSTNTLFSISDIARETERSNPAITAVINRIQLTPAATLPSGRKLYTREQISEIEKAMRQPNAK